ncbi:hypothetical protein RHGRI_014569 [Rhododendron griersonianum]|uniref:Signal peptidase complex subunit 3 n=1 Tax=Rhododendron griersonianum TaxID=479676 RepID=A0AAV6K9U7_9ERIC|nr:hypothetical protein RHGRI_014569 [Rhododendron griersonianum]
MHSFGFRANALLTFSVTILALICAMASLSDNLNSPSPSAHVQVANINRFQKSRGNDEVSLTLNVSANLQSLFTWNTKQVFVFLAAEYESPKNSLNQLAAIFHSYNCDCASGVLSRAQVALDCILAFVFFSVVSLWDAIIPSKEQAQFLIQTKNKYRFTDQGTNLQGKEYNLTLHWHVMPKTGKMFADKIVMTGFRLPEAYR